ncbi:hypothetical protein [Yersinia pseudotuberculosis]|uniref:hypothetical protein n=1 Tax=Yersinia pseudotuberculosis TaxID=633 RepID=UPI00057084DB
MDISPEVSNYIRSKQIRFAKSRKESGPEPATQQPEIPPAGQGSMYLNDIRQELIKHKGASQP